jgi:hypothetical protein
MQVIKVLKEAATPVALLLLIVVTLFSRSPARPDSSPSPHGHTPDAAVVKMGRNYGRALVEAAADTLEASASRPWNSTAQAAQQNLDDFDERVANAWKPVAAELSRRFGPASDQAVDSARGAEIRQFWRDLATGIHQEAKP